MKVAIFTDTFYPNLGGMEDATAALAQALGERGHEVIVFAPFFPARDFNCRDLPVDEPDLGDRVKIRRLFSLPIFGKIPGGRIIIPLGAGYRFLKKEVPDIIHTQSIFGAGLEALIASRCLGIKLVGTNHSILSEFAVYSPIAKGLFSRVAAGYEAWFYNHCDFLSTASRAVFEALSKAGFNQPHKVVSNIVDTKTFKPADNFSPDPFTVVYAGRFALEKKGEILFYALALVKKTIPQVKLILAGAGPEEDNWKKIIRELNLEANVRFVGKLTKSQLAQLFQKTKVFVIASAIENQSMVVLQAMACGLPVIGVNGRGMPELVKDKETGFIVPVDDFQQMAERVVELLIKPEQASLLGSGGRRRIESYTGENIAIEWERIYQQVINGHAS